MLWFVYESADLQTNRQTDRQMDKCSDRQANHFTDKQSEIQRTDQLTGQLIDIPTDGATHRQADIKTKIVRQPDKGNNS